MSLWLFNIYSAQFFRETGVKSEDEVYNYIWYIELHFIEIPEKCIMKC